MPRYEHDGEFWDITHDGTRLVIVSGEIGRAGKETVRKFVAADKAEAQFVKLIGEKQAAGWTFVDRASEPDDDAPAPRLDEPHEPQLEAAILANPYDEAAYSVYADWLQSQGAPRGQLIALQLAEENAPDNPKYRAATKKFLAEHMRTFGRGLDEHLALRGEHGPALIWRFGFLHRIVFDREMDTENDLPELLRDVLRHPSGRFVAEIDLRDRDVEQYDDVIDAIGTHAPATVREVALKFGGELGGFDPLLRLPLAKLVVKARYGLLTNECLHSITRAPATLEALEIRCGEDDSYAALAPLFARTDLTKLTRFVLRGCTAIDEVMVAFATCPFAKQLTWLDVSMIDIGTEAATRLADRERLPKLKKLRLSTDRINPRWLLTLRNSGIKVEDVRVDRDDMHEDAYYGDDNYDEIQE